MAKYDFSIRYYGNALEDGRIPIKDLAPSFLTCFIRIISRNSKNIKSQ
ncbi:hypothetical protein [Listeria seeligeri]|nr:hypothetical protein [Listeria seeligeri]